jgi:Asparagine synthase (glutamine-hydrolyzing)
MSARGLLAAFGARDCSGLDRAARRHGLVARSVPAGLLYLGTELSVETSPGSIVVGDAFPDPRERGRLWGNYLRIAFVGQGGPRIERAPVTGTPLYWARWRGGVLCFSHLELVDGLGIERAIDWDFVRHSLAYRNFRTERTGIEGVRELLPGMALTLDGADPAVCPFWLPWAYAGRKGDWDLRRAAETVEQCVLMSVDRWASQSGDIVLELSGGLDSSIIAASLAVCGYDFTGVTVATATPDGDERRYARDVARACGGRLIECPVDATAIDLVAPPARLTPRPAAAPVLAGFDRAIAEAVAARGRSPIWSGIGGDNVFAFSHSVSPAVDAIRVMGPKAPLWRILGEIATIAGTTRWHAAKHLLRRLGSRTIRPPWPRDDIFARRTALPVEPFLHPWQEGAPEILPGKRQHVEALMRILDFLDRPDRWHDRKVVAPLLSQPLVETCLAIPSWLWIAGGRDRAVARTAFGRHLPPAVVNRRTKGRLESMCAAAFQRERARLAPFLLDGRLAGEGLLDRQAIEHYFARDGVDSEFAYFRLLEIADLERWLRSVESTRSPGGASAAQRAY